MKGQQAYGLTAATGFVKMVAGMLATWTGAIGHMAFQSIYDSQMLTVW
jgi:hypothetical protein